MNKNQKLHNERKEYWREQIALCEASGMSQQDWCWLNLVCYASMSRWRTIIWREDEEEKEFREAREENCFVEISAELVEASTSVTRVQPRTDNNSRATKVERPEHDSNEVPRIATPDVVIGYRDYMIGVYEHTSNQVLQKVMEVLQYA